MNEREADKYDEKANMLTYSVGAIFQSGLGEPSKQTSENLIAQALRDSAAEAFEEAATIMRFDPNGEYWPGRFEDKAAALRSLPAGEEKP